MLGRSDALPVAQLYISDLVLHPSLSPPLPLFGVLDSICFNLGHYYRLLSLHLTLMPISVISVIKRLLCPSYSHELTILTILTAVARGEFIIIDARH